MGQFRVAKSAEAQNILGELNRTAQRRYTSSTDTAAVYAGLGEKGTAFEWLKKALDEHDNWLVELEVDPKFDNLRSDPRFQDLLHQIGLWR